MIATMEVWGTALAPIPDEWVDIYLFKAIRHSKGYLVNPGHIYAEWDNEQAREMRLLYKLGQIKLADVEAD